MMDSGPVKITLFYLSHLQLLISNYSTTHTLDKLSEFVVIILAVVTSYHFSYKAS